MNPRLQLSLVGQNKDLQWFSGTLPGHGWQMMSSSSFKFIADALAGCFTAERGEPIASSPVHSATLALLERTPLQDTFSKALKAARVSGLQIELRINENFQTRPAIGR